MTAQAFSSPHARLPAVTPEAAAARNAWLAALNGLRVDGAPLRVRVRTSGAAGAGLVLAAGDQAVWLAAEVVDGQPVPPLATGPALPEALVEISRLEPLIAAVERACGRVLEPVEIGPPPPGLMLELELTDAAGALRHLAHLVIPPGLRPPPSPRPPGRLDRAARARVACRLTLQGPRAPRGELATLEAGDVVVIPHGPGARLPARLEVGNMSWRGGFQPDGSALHIEREDHPMLDDPPSPEGPGMGADTAAPHEQASSARFAELPVRLEVALPSLHLSVGELAALAPGSVTALPVTGEDLAVRLVTEGVEVASGRLVALGSGYGVLVETVSEPATAGTAP